VRVGSNAILRNSVILTDSVIEPGAIVDHAIIDKRVVIGTNSRVGGKTGETEPAIAMVGKNSHIPPGYTIESGAIIATDVIESDYSGNIIRGDEYIPTKRMPYEV
jgi:glucose-1-phosphate adenylyltransferase